MAADIKHSVITRNLHEFHTEALAQYMLQWQERDWSRGTEDELAYHILAHAGFLAREQDINLNAELDHLQVNDCDRLVVAACQYTNSFELSTFITDTLKAGDLEEDDLPVFEQLLIQRDEMDVVIETIKSLIGLRVKDDDKLLDAISTAIGVATGIDDQLETRPALVTVASRILEGYRDENWLCSGSYPDWYAAARQRDRVVLP